MRDDEAFVKEIEGIYGSHKEKLGGCDDGCVLVKGPPRDCLSDASMETSAQSLRGLQASMNDTTWYFDGYSAVDWIVAS